METLIIYIFILGRINFLQLGRYGKSCEQRFRQNFLKDFDWCRFNLFLSDLILTKNRKAIAVDPSYISKSRKNTAWIAYFWSGAVGQSKWGLEILGIGLVDTDNKDCIYLEAVQTPDTQTLESRDSNLIDCYLRVLGSIKEKLQRASHHVVAEAYFSKISLVEGFALVSRFRNDVVLFYPTLQKTTGKRGRPKCYDGRIDMANLDKSRVEKIDIENGELYTLIVWSNSLGKKVRLAIRYDREGKTPKRLWPHNYTLKK